MKRTIRTALKRPDDSSKLVLREIIGLTTTDCNGLASSVSSSICVYIAGCFVVVYGVESGRQSHLVVTHRTPRPLSCVAVSGDGRFIAAGESGTQPSVLVWDCVSLALISELKGHLFGVKCISFSPDGIHLASVGGHLHLWEWRFGTLRKKIKASSSCSGISSVSFSSDAMFVVTSGKRHLKFWVVERSPKTRSNKGFKSLAMNGISVDLGLQKESTFVSIASTPSLGKASDMCFLYALTEAGVLCVIHSGLSIRKSMDLKVEKGFAVSVSKNLIACACSNGIVRLFTIDTLKHAGTLLHTQDRKVSAKNDIASNVKAVENDSQTLSSLPDAVACQFTASKKLVVVYGDHSLYIWNIQNINQATRCYVLFSHSACIWDIKNLCCDNFHEQSLACAARGCSGGLSFATCSADGTIRLWDLLFQPDSLDDFADIPSLKIQSMSSTSLVRTATFERDSMELDSSSQGFRSMAVSPDGKYLAAGDNKGSIHIYDMINFDYKCLQEAHDSEVLSLSFGLTRKNCADSKEITGSRYFLSSGGRDRLINLYDARRNFDLVETIDDHSAAVTSVKLASDGCKILSCSADRSLVFRDASVTSDAFRISHRLHQTASQGTVYDMAVDSKMEIAVTVGQDKKINTFNIASGKLIRSFDQNKDFGDPIKVAMDPSCSYLVCSYSNKSLCIYDFITGDLVSQAMGHSEIVTSFIFLSDCKHIVSVGGDGCIFVWQLPAILSSTMQQRIEETLGPLSLESSFQPIALRQIIPSEEQLRGRDSRDQCSEENIESIEPKDNQLVGNFNETLEFKFSVSRLPRWAQDKLTSSNVVPRELNSTSLQEVELQHVSSPLASDIQGSTHDSLEVQIPYEHENEVCHGSSSASTSYDSDNYASPIHHGTSFLADKRWNCIYTVCWPNSSDMLSERDTNMPVSSQNLLQERIEISSNGHDFGLESQRTVQCGSTDANECHHSALDVVEQVHSCTDAFHTNSEESDLFKKHFGSLSSTHKIERGHLSKRQRLSARFASQRDHNGGFKKLFDSPSKHLNANTLNYVEETSDDLSLRSPDERRTSDSCKQDPKNKLMRDSADNEVNRKITKHY